MKFLIIIVIILFLVSYFYFRKIKSNTKNSSKAENFSYYEEDLSYSILNRNILKNNNSSTLLIDKNIILVEDKCFINCKKLSNINVDEENKNYCSKLGVLFSKDMNNLVFYPPLKLTSTYFIPEGVTTINEHAFVNNNNLKYVIIPQSMKSINKNAFVNCKFINQVVIPDNIIDIHPRAFSLCPRITIRCYKDSVADGYCKKYYIPCDYLNI